MTDVKKTEGWVGTLDRTGRPHPGWVVGDADTLVACLAADWSVDYVSADMNRLHEQARSLVDGDALAARRAGWVLDVGEATEPEMLFDAGRSTERRADDWEEARGISGVAAADPARVRHLIVTGELAEALRGEGEVVTELAGIEVWTRFEATAA